MAGGAGSGSIAGPFPARVDTVNGTVDGKSRSAAGVLSLVVYKQTG